MGTSNKFSTTWLAQGIMINIGPWMLNIKQHCVYHINSGKGCMNDERAYHKQTNIPTSSCQRFDEWFGQQLQTNKSNDKKCN